MVLGIDVGAVRLHCVALDDGGTLIENRVLRADELGALSAWASAASAIAVDAPARPSTAPHADRDDLSPKFRTARCAEIDLGRRFGLWVSWTTPTHEPFPGWMNTGFGLYEALPRAIEVYPYAAFRRLADGARLPKKTTAIGRHARADLLRGAGVTAPNLETWSHDFLDAAGAALVALRHARGHAIQAGCGHDDSAIWLPA